MIVFIVLSLINVFLGCLKAVAKIHGNKHAMLIQAISYTFYAATVSLMGQFDLWFVVLVTFVTNIIGYMIAEWFFDKHIAEEKLWRISVTVSNKNQKAITELKNGLEKYNIAYTKILTIDNKHTIFDIYSKTSGETGLIKEVIINNKCKYHVLEIKQSL